MDPTLSITDYIDIDPNADAYPDGTSSTTSSSDDYNSDLDSDVQDPNSLDSSSTTDDSSSAYFDDIAKSEFISGE